MYAYISLKLKWLYHQFLYPDGLLTCFPARLFRSECDRGLHNRRGLRTGMRWSVLHQRYGVFIPHTGFSWWASRQLPELTVVFLPSPILFYCSLLAGYRVSRGDVWIFFQCVNCGLHHALV
nr:hypothetical protein [Klebsiella pneumoniae]QUW42238.1 hypothetical protein [Escherichia coli]QUW41484.1 hypothetical protein [Klebsiella pneumoniae]QUW42590.1 hypothetical protein [Escherichia coli]QUW42805.1 hypothetical protein [Escherichia coli]